MPRKRHLPPPPPPLTNADKDVLCEAAVAVWQDIGGSTLRALQKDGHEPEMTRSEAIEAVTDENRLEKCLIDRFCRHDLAMRTAAMDLVELTAILRPAFMTRYVL